MEKYESNSHRSKELQREEVQSEKRVQKVVTGNVKTRKNEVRKFTDIFISEDAANVKSYICMDVLVPAIKKAISDIVTEGVDMILYGGTGGGKRKTSSGNKVSYRKYYDDRRDDRRETSYRDRNRFDYDDIVFDSRVEAEAVRSEMMDCIERYGMVSVADMYDMAGLAAPYTSSKFGWTSIRTAEVKRVRDGFIIELPRAIAFD